MSVSIAFAQTTIALRDMLQTALRLDAGWRLTGGVPRVTISPHGAPGDPSGARLDLALVAASPSLQRRNRPPDPRAEREPPLVFDLRYLITAHMLLPLHAELLLGAALEVLLGNPVLRRQSAPIHDALETVIMAGAGGMSDDPPRLAVEVADAPRDIGLGPVLLIRVSPVIFAPRRSTPLPVIER